jgi:surface polysaccharide O-acyltransferase-like enzyme
MEKIKDRQSNIELLRTVAIFLVMVAHCNCWLGGGLPDSSTGMTDVFWGKHIIASLSSICVVLFVLISGYFSIKPKLKSLLTLWTQIFFVYLCLFVIRLIVIGGGY